MVTVTVKTGEHPALVRIDTIRMNAGMVSSTSTTEPVDANSSRDFEVTETRSIVVSEIPAE